MTHEIFKPTAEEIKSVMNAEGTGFHEAKAQAIRDRMHAVIYSSNSFDSNVQFVIHELIKHHRPQT